MCFLLEHGVLLFKSGDQDFIHLQHKEFKQDIQKWWKVSFQANWAARELHLKLWSLKVQLKVWNKEVLGFIPQLKDNLTAQISLLDAKE